MICKIWNYYFNMTSYEHTQISSQQATQPQLYLPPLHPPPPSYAVDGRLRDLVSAGVGTAYNLSSALLDNLLKSSRNGLTVEGNSLAGKANGNELSSTGASIIGINIKPYISNKENKMHLICLL